MGDASSKTVIGLFSTREAADRAVEHLVQQFGIDRADIFVQPEGKKNSAGTKVSGGDASRSESDKLETTPVLAGRIEVAADVSLSDQGNAEKALREAGAERVITR